MLNAILESTTATVLEKQKCDCVSNCLFALIMSKYFYSKFFQEHKRLSSSHFFPLLGYQWSLIVSSSSSEMQQTTQLVGIAHILQLSKFFLHFNIYRHNTLGNRTSMDKVNRQDFVVLYLRSLAT